MPHNSVGSSLLKKASQYRTALTGRSSDVAQTMTLLQHSPPYLMPDGTLYIHDALRSAMMGINPMLTHERAHVPSDVAFDGIF